jgi:hypothetical protein
MCVLRHIKEFSFVVVVTSYSARQGVFEIIWSVKNIFDERNTCSSACCCVYE